MLTNYLKSQQRRYYRVPVRNPTPVIQKVYYIPIILCGALVLCAIIIPLALIPLYIQRSNQGSTNNNNNQDTLKCTDTAGYSESITGYTCQTYIDYGFCNGSQITGATSINAQLAQENCCFCGKKP